MTLHLPHGKTDKLRKDNELIIAGTGNITCPVAMLEMYMTQTYVSLDDHCFLFKPICKSNQGEKLRESVRISLRDLFMKCEFNRVQAA